MRPADAARAASSRATAARDAASAVGPALRCLHAARCPGCPLIELAPAAQLAAKAARLAAALAPYPELAAARAGPVRAATPARAYRTRAKLVVAPGPRVGLYARGGGHEVLDLPHCLVLAPVVAEAAAALRRLLAAPPAAAGALLRAEGDGTGCLRALDLREVKDEAGAGVLVTLVLRAPPAPDAAALRAAGEALARELPALRTLAVSEHDGRPPLLLGAPPRVVRGPVQQRDRLRADAPWVWAAPGSFAQAHRGQAAAIHAEVERALGLCDTATSGSALRRGARGDGSRATARERRAGAEGRRRVLELYAGTGGLGLTLAARGAEVVMVESFAPAARAALDAARAQGLAAVAVRPGSDEVEVARLRADGARFDAVVANPPRRGIPPRVREGLAALCAGPLVYVSCEPETLARDLAHFARLGLALRRLVPFDLMPQTAEVESVAWLEPAPPPPPAVLYEDETLLAVAKPPFVPTHPHPEQPSSLQGALRALPGAASAVPLHRLDVGTSGVCLFARSAQAVAPWQRALQAGSKRYLALVRGVARARGRIAASLREAGRVREAATRYRRLGVHGGHALLELELETGRTHQIRRHLAAIGQPVLGDERHGHAPSNRHAFERLGLDRPFLHAAVVELPHPDSGRPLRIEAPLAPDLAAVLARLADSPQSPRT